MSEVDSVDLEDLFNRFRHLCDQMESQNLPLEESVRLYAQGVALSAQIKAELSRAERFVVEVIQADGTIVPFDGGRAKK